MRRVIPELVPTLYEKWNVLPVHNIWTYHDEDDQLGCCPMAIALIDAQAEEGCAEDFAMGVDWDTDVVVQNLSLSKSYVEGFQAGYDEWSPESIAGWRRSMSIPTAYDTGVEDGRKTFNLLLDMGYFDRDEDEG